MDRMTTQQILKADGTTDAIPVASTGTIYSHSMKIDEATAFAASLKASGTAPDIDVYVEQTHIKPVTEGEAPTAANGWAQAVGATKVADILLDATWYHFTISPISLPYIRFKLMGQGANPANCTLQAFLTKLVNFGL